MMRKQVAFFANSLESAYKFQRVLSRLKVEVHAASVAQMEGLLNAGRAFDLVIFEAIGGVSARVANVGTLVDSLGVPLLVIVDQVDAENLGLPEHVPSDFVVANAGAPECSARVMRLLRTPASSSSADTIEIDDMLINPNTYQVTVGGEPVDLTYLEYALLAFFVQHPGRTFTRDVLLQNVWGFDYYGGSRTVDVHVRRIRAKLGPRLAQHLETIRGVGYLWKADV